MRRCWERLRSLALLAMVLTALALTAAAAGTPEEFYGELESNLRAQKQTFSIVYTADAQADGLIFPPEAQLAMLQRQLAARSPCGPDSGDKPAMNIKSGSVQVADGIFQFEMTYLSTPPELAEVSRRAKEIVALLELEEAEDFTKIKLLYEYVATHYTYDDTLTKFAAYDGLTTGSMVCQGYALLVYELMWEAGIPCRLITGISQGQAHAWNIVKLQEKWYNLDATWDAAEVPGGAMQWNFFLKSAADFTGHTRHDAYAAPAYGQVHPMSPVSAELPQITLRVEGRKLTGLVLRTGVEVQLQAQLPKGVPESPILWRSADTPLLTVTPDGRARASRVGQTHITAELPGNRGVISAQLPVQAVNLDTASPWARETVTKFYLDQLLPPTLCANFQGGLTRGELARLLNHFVVKTRGYDSFSLHNQYTDIENCPDALAILNCKAIGLLDGLSPTRFGPYELVTREQAAKALVRLQDFLEDAAYEARELPLSYRDAAAVSPWAAPFVAAAAAQGTLQGADARFRPRQAMRLEELIAALSRVHTTWAAAHPPAEKEAA